MSQGCLRHPIAGMRAQNFLPRVNTYSSWVSISAGRGISSPVTMKRLLVIPLLVLVACDKKPAAAPKAPETAPKPAAQAPAFEPGPAPNRGKGGEYFRIDEAMTIADVKFLLRTSTSEGEILKEIAERGFRAPIPPAEANSLSENGGSPRLISLVQDQRYVLTPPEMAEFNARQQRRASRGALPADPKQREKEFEERQKKLHAQ